jgi:CheY-like chemotaxis protein
MADPGRLEQVVLNLVVNAEQAMASAAGHGTLVLRTRSGLQGNTLTVEDTGPGIALEDQERIFDPFWSTKAPGEGTGLGLSVVHGIVDGLGGRISVESQPKAGARFTVLLPHADARARTPAEPPAAARDASPASRLRVLVVDDEPSVRTVLSLYLRRCGHEVDEAAEGGAALDLLDEAALHGRCYQAILSDLRMPGLDGSQLLARLREQGGEWTAGSSFSRATPRARTPSGCCRTPGFPSSSSPSIWATSRRSSAGSRIAAPRRRRRLARWEADIQSGETGGITCRGAIHRDQLMRSAGFGSACLIPSPEIRGATSPTGSHTEPQSHRENIGSFRSSLSVALWLRVRPPFPALHTGSSELV